MENFKFKLKFFRRFIVILLLLTVWLTTGESAIDTYISNYSHSILKMPAAVQIQLTNYLLLVNTLEPLAGNDDIDSSLTWLMQNSDSESVRHHAKIVRTAILNNRPAILNYKNRKQGLKNSNEIIERSVLIFLEFINRNMFNNR